ncbi:hypothetical protein ACFO1B_37765 [Dactylosporangium siamense]|uniref:Uncharacterized protein n=1 Tax=Dactylosporangium siamense TaxID=685454 RepID=A0A919PW79_9ACTN|nr:hypothetical protein [Dactylosporangium siamense]GIG49520.1 hypothetical protein Dsi01nite_075610 [Dactylosporangium siamense]
MRRALGVLIAATGLLLVASPASAFAHNAVHDRWLHLVLDGLTLAVVTAPLWTAYLWGAARRRLLLGLVAVVQLPVAVIGFVPIATPWIHLAAFGMALGLTAFSLWYVHRPAPRPSTVVVSGG